MGGGPGAQPVWTQPRDLIRIEKLGLAGLAFSVQRRRHLERLKHYRRLQRGAHRPADNAATEDIDDNGQIEEARGGR